MLQIGWVGDIVPCGMLGVQGSALYLSLSHFKRKSPPMAGSLGGLIGRGITPRGRLFEPRGRGITGYIPVAGPSGSLRYAQSRSKLFQTILSNPVGLRPTAALIAISRNNKRKGRPVGRPFHLWLGERQFFLSNTV